MTTAWTLVIVLIVLVSLVLILAIIWAYIYYAKIRPRKRSHETDESLGGFYYRHEDGSARPASGRQDWEQGETAGQRSHAFLIWHYSKRMRGGDRQDFVT